MSLKGRANDLITQLQGMVQEVMPQRTHTTFPQISKSKNEDHQKLENIHSLSQVKTSENKVTCTQGLQVS